MSSYKNTTGLSKAKSRCRPSFALIWATQLTNCAKSLHSILCRGQSFALHFVQQYAIALHAPHRVTVTFPHSSQTIVLLTAIIFSLNRFKRSKLFLRSKNHKTYMDKMMTNILTTWNFTPKTSLESGYWIRFSLVSSNFFFYKINIDSKFYPSDFRYWIHFSFVFPNKVLLFGKTNERWIQYLKSRGKIFWVNFNLLIKKFF